MDLPRALTIARDVVGIAGAAGIGFGFWQVYHPLGPIIGGGLALAGAVLMAWKER